MLRCKHCKVDLPGNQSRCPLCQNKPTGTPEPYGDPFPRLPSPQRTVSKILIAWLAFGSVCIAAICMMINMILGGWWSLFVIAGIASLWTDFALILKKRKNLPKNILWQVISISLIALLWDFLTGFHGWALDYVFPILCSCAMIAMMIVAKARRLEIQDYISYLLIDCVLGGICSILILTGVVSTVIPSAICFGITLVFLAFLLFFEGKALWAEFQRRLHL